MDEGLIQSVLAAMGSKKIRRSGHNIMASCPFAPYSHKGSDDRNPSMSIQINNSGPSAFHCFTCLASGKKSSGLIYKWKEHSGQWLGDLYNMIKAQEGYSPSERLKKLGDWNTQGREVRKTREPVSWFVNDYEAKFNLETFNDFLASIPRYGIDRGITVEQAKKWKIGFHKDYKRLFFAILNENHQMIGWSARAIFPDQEPKYLHAEYMKRDKYLYGECFVDKSIREGYLMEGFMDVLNLDRMGVKNCLATLGTGVSELHVEKLVKWFDKVIILPHDDPPDAKGERPGQKMAEGYSHELKNRGIDVIIAPIVSGKKDPGEWNNEDLIWVQDCIRRWSYVE